MLSAFKQDKVMIRKGKFDTVGKLLPKFPRSSMYYWNLDEDFINGRKVELEQYSQSLVDLF